MNYDEDKREFFRVDYETPVKLKVQGNEKFVTKSEVVSQNISPSGILFRTDSESSIPPISSVVWVELDPKMLTICEEIEGDLVIHEGGVFGRVVRISEGVPGESYDIGVCFLRRQNLDDSQIESLRN